MGIANPLSGQFWGRDRVRSRKFELCKDEMEVGADRMVGATSRAKKDERNNMVYNAL